LQGCEGALKRIAQYPALGFGDGIERIHGFLQRFHVELHVAAGPVPAVAARFVVRVNLRSCPFPAAKMRGFGHCPHLFGRRRVGVEGGFGGETAHIKHLTVICCEYTGAFLGSSGTTSSLFSGSAGLQRLNDLAREHRAFSLAAGRLATCAGSSPASVPPKAKSAR
jgi:hypothetical protein